MADKKKERLIWLDGLKGLACLGVFIHHFFLGFYPASYFGNVLESGLNGLDHKLSCEPIGFLINGNFWVNVFVLVAAFLPASAIMRCRDEEIKSRAGNMILKRYPRLAIPVTVACIIYYVVMRVLIHIGANYMDKELTYGPGQYMLHVLFTQYLQEDSTIQGSYWTLHELFVGALFAILISIPSGKKRPWMLPVYLGIFAAFRAGSVSFMACALGVFLADMVTYGRCDAVKEKLVFLKDKKAGVILSLLTILLAFFLGGYPSYAEPAKIYGIVKPVAVLLSPIGIHALAAYLLVGGIYMLHTYTKFSILSTMPFRFLGRICMGIYLFHLMWIELLGYWLKDKLAAGMSSNTAVLATFGVIGAAVLITAALFNITVEKPAEKLLAKFGTAKASAASGNVA
ncbi:MAG: acyltransferase [Lachnospiraceae bacterium]|nr:acyltransferase [Lachnospiraceae bacterium]